MRAHKIDYELRSTSRRERKLRIEEIMGHIERQNRQN